ncbi:MAG: sugar ABC transporter ATP-binding protein [Thermoprotei archaeon]|nr:MAG: sugar ABC transporter ATP-binding protein [Thermoprotei archaeon]
MVSVKLEKLTKYFGKVAAVKNLNLEIKDGEFVALLGPSGCGKSTTLLMIAGIYKPTSGYIYFDDVIVNDLPPKDRNIGMVFQSYALYPHMRVYDNIAFPLKLQKLPKDEIRRRIKRAAELLKIEDLLDRKPAQLSGGQQQRVALARALVKQPQLFLMDEPLSNLDAKLRVLMRAEIKRLQKQLGITTIYVTHDQIEAMTMADRVAVLNKGELQQYSSADELYNKPRNLFVAGFIGSPPMNFIDCTLVEKEGNYYLDAGSFMVKLPIDLGKLVAEKATGPELVLGVRPEDLKISLKPTENSIESNVYVLEPLGKDTIVNVKLGDTLVKILAPPYIRLSIGDRIWIVYDLNKIHIFDKKTEKAIL